MISNNINGSKDTLICDCIPRPSEGGGGGDSDDNPFSHLEVKVGELSSFSPLSNCGKSYGCLYKLYFSLVLAELFFFFC